MFSSNAAQQPATKSSEHPLLGGWRGSAGVGSPGPPAKKGAPARRCCI